MTKTKNFGFALASFVLVLAVWQLTALAVAAWSNVPFPTPWATSLRLWGALGGDILVDHTLYRHVIDSLGRWIMAFLAAAASAVAFGLAAGRWRAAEKITMPIVHILQLVPGLAWISAAINKPICGNARDQHPLPRDRPGPLDRIS